MKNVIDLFSEFSLLNGDEEMNIRGGILEEKWTKDCNLLGDIHACASYEVKCPGTFTYSSTCKILDLEGSKCSSNFEIKRV